MERGLACRALRLVRTTPDGADRVILADVTAGFPAASLSVIEGPVGAGKSTLLYLLAALIRPTAGEVLADGEPVSRFVPEHRDRWRQQVGLAFQSDLFIDELTAVENTMAPLVPRSGTLRESRALARRALDQLAIGHLADRPILELSAGERQRVTLARALVGAPRFLLVDEPTAHQDDAGAALIAERLRNAREAGNTVVVTTHDDRLQQLGLADKNWSLREGRLESAS